VSELQRRRARFDIESCRLVPKESAATIAKRKPIQRRFEIGEIYGGLFKNMPATKKGLTPLVILADRGEQIHVAPVVPTAKSKQKSIATRAVKGFAGVVAMDHACTIDKRLLTKKLGRIEDPALEALQSAQLEQTVKLI
jgi:hypothetical protein